MAQRLIRFKKGPNTRRSYFLNRFLVSNLGKTRKELASAVAEWEETIQTQKHGEVTLEVLLSMPGQGFDEMLYWCIEDFTFFSWHKGCLALMPDNLETCLLVDRLIQAGVPMGKNQGQAEGSIAGAWKRGGLKELQELAVGYGLPE